MELAFRWGALQQEDPASKRRYFEGFWLQAEYFAVGDTVFLAPPEGEGAQPYLARLISAFADGNNAYSIEVRWFERLPKSAADAEEREVVELEDTDINPVGAVSGHATVLNADSLEQAELMAGSQRLTGSWVFSRGMYKQSTNEFVPHGMQQRGTAPSTSGSKRRAEDGADSVDQQSRPGSRAAKHRGKGRQNPSADSGSREGAAAEAEEAAALSSPASAKCLRGKGPGQQCVECGATQTPQWREGPAGPKTLCNACGVRYNRLRANRRGGSLRQFQGRGRGGRAPAACAAPEAPSSRATVETGPEEQEASAPSMVSDRGQRRRQQQQQQQQVLAGDALLSSRRPVRQAALASASRTAAIARLGVLAEDDDEDDMEEDERQEEYGLSGMEDRARTRQGAGTAGAPEGKVGARTAAALSTGSTGEGALPTAEECSLDSSRSAEGCLLRVQAPTPTPLAQAARLQSAGSSAVLNVLNDRVPTGVADGIAELDPPTPGSDVFGCDLTATVGAAEALGGCMVDWSVQQQQLLRGSMQGQGAGAASSAAGSTLRRVALRAVGFCPDATEFGEVFSSLEALEESLPAADLQQLLGLAEQVDSAAGSAAEAEVELQAAAQVMAARQKAADASRERAFLAVERLKCCMSDLVQQHGQAVPSCTRVTPLFPSDDCHAMLGLNIDSTPLPWSQHVLDHEHHSLLETSALLDLGAADNGASLLCLDDAF